MDDLPSTTPCPNYQRLTPYPQRLRYVTAHQVKALPGQLPSANLGTRGLETPSNNQPEKG